VSQYSSFGSSTQILAPGDAAELISKATINYVGFNSDKTTEIYNGWNDWPPGPIIRETDPNNGTCLEVTFLDWMKRHAGSLYTDRVWQDDSSAWLRCMEQHGIATELQHAIMDPYFKQVWLTGTCIVWVQDTIDGRYKRLRDIQRASAERERAMQHSDKELSGSLSEPGHVVSGPFSHHRYLRVIPSTAVGIRSQ
jgi:hypothetical protein